MELPKSVSTLLSNSKVGYISVQTPSGRISTNPISYYFNDGYIYFLTPRASKRYKFMQSRPDVTFTIDNGELMEGCAGIMIQGVVDSFNPAKIVSSSDILIKFMRYIIKYPEGIPFYALGTLGLNTLPDERKIYKYNFLRINPTKVFFWDGYDFGRIGAKSGEKVNSDDPVLIARQALKGDFSLEGDETSGFDVLDVMNLSEPMRKTALALAMLSEANPKRIARETSQTVSTEKANLESLVRMGYALKNEVKKSYTMVD
jgi:hypothetical protein